MKQRSIVAMGVCVISSVALAGQWTYTEPNEVYSLLSHDLTGWVLKVKAYGPDLTVTGVEKTPLTPTALPLTDPITHGYRITDVSPSSSGFGKLLTEVSLPDSVTNIGACAFIECQGMTNIFLGKGMKFIGAGAFAYSGLTSVSLPDSVTHVSNGASSGCVVIGGAFSGCTALKNIVIGAGVSDMCVFCLLDCTSLTNISVHAANKVYRDINGVLFDKAGRTLLRYPTGRQERRYTVPEGVTYIAGASFWNSCGLGLLTISRSVTHIGNYAFYKCSGLTQVDIPDGVVEIADSAFSNCSSLSNFVLPASISRIAPQTFWECFSLSAVTIPNNVTQIDNSAFANCHRLTTVNIPGKVTHIGDYAFLYTGLTEVNIPSSVQGIGHAAFACNGLTSVVIHAGVTQLGSDAFSGANLAHISIAAENPSYRDLDGVVFDKAGTTLMIYPKGRNTKRYVIPTGVTRIGALAFSRSPHLEEIVMPPSLTTIENNAFLQCANLTKVTLPHAVTNIGDWAFFQCARLENITIPNGVTCIGCSTFSNCPRLTRVVIPNSVTNIGEAAFAGCSGLAKVVIPDSVTSLGNVAFADCTNLTHVTIPRSVSKMTSGVFSRCSGLKSITFLGEHPNLEQYRFYTDSLPTNTVIYIDKASVGVWNKRVQGTIENGNATYLNHSIRLLEKTPNSD